MLNIHVLTYLFNIVIWTMTPSATRCPSQTCHFSCLLSQLPYHLQIRLPHHWFRRPFLSLRPRFIRSAHPAHWQWNPSWSLKSQATSILTSPDHLISKLIYQTHINNSHFLMCVFANMLSVLISRLLSWSAWWFSCNLGSHPKAIKGEIFPGASSRYYVW